MKIDVLTVRKKENKELIAAIGLEDDMNTIVSLPIKKENFTQSELDQLAEYGATISATTVFFGECEVYHLTKVYDKIVIAMEKIEVK